MGESKTDIENDDLDILATQAEAEDSMPEEPLSGDIETVEDQQEASEKGARMAAAGVINTVAGAVKMRWGIEYDESKKLEGVDAVAACFMADGSQLPPWAVDLIEHFGPLIKAGAFFVGAGIGTYQVIQEQKQQKEEANKNDKESTKRPAEAGKPVQPLSWFNR